MKSSDSADGYNSNHASHVLQSNYTIVHTIVHLEQEHDPRLWGVLGSVVYVMVLFPVFWVEFLVYFPLFSSCILFWISVFHSLFIAFWVSASICFNYLSCLSFPCLFKSMDFPLVHCVILCAFVPVLSLVYCLLFQDLLMTFIFVWTLWFSPSSGVISFEFPCPN